MNTRLLLVVLILVTSFFVQGCSPAKYRGWEDGDQYFERTNQADPVSESDGAPPHQTKQKSERQCTSLYVVRSGDTLSQIAAKCQVSMLRIAYENDLVPPYTLFVRQELIIPKHHSVPMASKDSSLSEANPKKSALVSESQSESLSDASKAFIWPAKVEQKYNYVMDAAGVYGLVVYGKVGSGVYAMADGRVVYAGDGIEDFGKMIIIKHEDRHLTVYAHNDSLLVDENQTVKQGDLIATLGATGSVTQPQLYVEARYRGRKINIKPLLEKK